MKTTAHSLAHNPISVDGGNRYCKQLQKILLRGKATDLGTANGLQLMWITWVNPVFILRDTETLEVIGYMDLAKVDPDWGLRIKYYQQGVYIKPAYRKRGLGTVLYLGVLHVFQHFVSDPIIGIDAVRAWKAIEKYGYKVKMWDSDNHQDVAFVWAPDGQPLIHGHTMDKYEETLLFYV
jgi:GNAT superfamily N-acetyltransferase